MSDLQDTKVNPEKLVAQYLKEHPDFFIKHPDILTELSLPHESGQAVSLVERQVSILRERNMEMRNRLTSLLDNARENDRLFDKTKRLVLALAEAPDLDRLAEALHYSFENDFKIHYTRLILFNSTNIPVNKARTDDIYTAKNHIGKRLQSGKTVTGGLDIKEIEYLFDTDAHNIGSGALAVLSHGHTIGLLAIGNQDPTYYHQSMGTLFLNYIAEVLNRLLPPLIRTV